MDVAMKAVPGNFDWGTKNSTVPSSHQNDCMQLFLFLGNSFWDSPDPRQGPESQFSGKEGCGVQQPPVPLVLEKGVFLPENPLFSTREHIENGDARAYPPPPCC